MACPKVVIPSTFVVKGWRVFENRSRARVGPRSLLWPKAANPSTVVVRGDRLRGSHPRLYVCIVKRSKSEHDRLWGCALNFITPHLVFKGQGKVHVFGLGNVLLLRSTTKWPQRRSTVGGKRRCGLRVDRRLEVKVWCSGLPARARGPGKYVGRC